MDQKQGQYTGVSYNVHPAVQDSPLGFYDGYVTISFITTGVLCTHFIRWHYSWHWYTNTQGWALEAWDTGWLHYYYYPVVPGLPIWLLEYTQSLQNNSKFWISGIAFTLEEQDSKGNLPMLDMMWRWKGDNISTDVYRKPTHTDHYLQWDSHHWWPTNSVW